MTMRMSRFAVACLLVGKDKDAAATKQLLKGIQSIQIRSYEFATDFAYSAADIDAVRSQLAVPGWNQLVQVHNQTNCDGEPEWKSPHSTMRR